MVSFVSLKSMNYELRIQSPHSPVRAWIGRFLERLSLFWVLRQSGVKHLRNARSCLRITVERALLYGRRQYHSRFCISSSAAYTSEFSCPQNWLTLCPENCFCTGHCRCLLLDVWYSNDRAKPSESSETTRWRLHEFTPTNWMPPLQYSTVLKSKPSNGKNGRS